MYQKGEEQSRSLPELMPNIRVKAHPIILLSVLDVALDVFCFVEAGLQKMFHG